MTFLIQGWSQRERSRPGSCITFGKSVHPFAGMKAAGGETRIVQVGDDGTRKVVE